MKRSSRARTARIAMAMLLSLLALGSVHAAGETSGELDLVLLVDTSLSMAPFFPAVRSFVASSLVKSLLLPGDRLVLELVYGRQDRLFAGRIGSESDKEAVVRTVRSLSADGRFTDLGAALDRAVELLLELGSPERPKYVFLVTDERQEAQGWSKYAVEDFKLRHPLLRYVKRRDLGSFRLLSVGIGIEDSVEATTPLVMSYLDEPRGADPKEALEASFSLSAAAPLDAAARSASAESEGMSSSPGRPSSAEISSTGASGVEAPQSESPANAGDASSEAPSDPTRGQSRGGAAEASSAQRYGDRVLSPPLPAWAIATGLASLAAAAIVFILIRKRKQ